MAEDENPTSSGEPAEAVETEALPSDVSEVENAAASPDTDLDILPAEGESPAVEPEELPPPEPAKLMYQGHEVQYEDGQPSYRATIGRMDLGPEWLVPDPGQTNQIDWPPKEE